jgi:hypothetical protein
MQNFDGQLKEDEDAVELTSINKKKSDVVNPNALFQLEPEF